MTMVRLAAVLAALLPATGPLAAQEFVRDRDGNWYLVEEPIFAPEPVDPAYIPQPPRWREPPFGDAGGHLRGRVPVYDEPYPGVRVYEPRSAAAPDIYMPELDTRPEDFGGGATHRLDPYLRGTDDGPYAGYSLPDPSLDPGAGGAIPDGWREAPDALDQNLAVYVAAKRAAVARQDVLARAQAVKAANAWLVSLSKGPVSSSAIAVIDRVAGIETIDEDTTALPGAGTSLERPSVKPTAADREAAARVAAYGHGGMIEGLDGAGTAALDRFFGFDDGRLASRGG